MNATTIDLIADRGGRFALVFAFLIAAHFVAGAPILAQSNTPAAELVPQIGNAGPIGFAAFSRDGRLFATSNGGAIDVWDVKSGLVRREIDVPDGNGVFRFSPTEDLIAADSLGAITLCDAPTGRRVRTIKTSLEQHWALEFSPDGRLLATSFGLPQSSIICWEAHSARQAYRFANHFGWLPQLAFSPDGKQLAVGANRIAILDATTGIELRSIPRSSRGLIQLSYSPDGAKLAGLEKDKINVWNPNTGEIERTVMLPVDNTIYSPISHGEGVSGFTAPGRNRTSAVGAPCILWDERRGLKLLALEGHLGEFAQAAFSPNGSAVATGFGAESVRVWDSSSGRVVQNLPLNSAATAENQQSLSGRYDWPERHSTRTATQIRFSPDGKSIAAASNDGLAHFWDAKSGKRVPTTTGRARDVLAVQFGADEMHFRIAFRGDKVAEWDVASSVAVRTIGSRKPVASNEPEFGGRHELAALRADGFTANGPYDGPISAAADPGGKYVAMGCERGKIVIFDRPKQQELLVWQAHHGEVNDLALSRDGTQLVSCASGEPPALWNARTGRKIRELEGATAAAWCVAISPDDRFALVGSLDGKCDLWELASGKHLLTLINVDGGADWLAFDPDGHFDGSPFGRRLVAFRTVSGDMSSSDELLQARFSSGLVGHVLQRSGTRRIVRQCVTNGPEGR